MMDREQIERDYRRELRRCDIQERIGCALIWVSIAIAVADLFFIGWR